MRHGQLIWRVVHQGCRHNIGLRTQVLDCHLGNQLRQGLEHLEVGACLPRRVDSRVEGVNIGVHVRGGQVFLLIPGGCRQYDVGVQGGGGVTEVRSPHQIQLARGRRLIPLHGLGAQVLRGFVNVYVIAGTQHVTQEELGALSRRTQQVGTPVSQDAREVLGARGGFASKMQLASLKLAHNVFLNIHALFTCLLRQEQRVTVKGGVGGHPAALHGFHHEVRVGLAHHGAGMHRGGDAVSLSAVVAPLLSG